MSCTCTRRSFLGMSAGAVFASRLAPLFGQESRFGRAKNCIFLYMSGGPSHLETWDHKEGSSCVKAIDTAVRGVRISEHLPRLAKVTDRLSIVRSMTSTEADHAPAATLMLTGNGGGASAAQAFPAFGAVCSKEWSPGSAALPTYVGVGSGGGPAFLGNEHGAFMVDLSDPLSILRPREEDQPRLTTRLGLLKAADDDFVRRTNPTTVTDDERKAVHRAVEMMGPKAYKAFDVSQENERVRAAYGDAGDTPSAFGRGCLLARRLVEHGVRFVEVILDKWDMHYDIDQLIGPASEELDAGMGTLIQELTDRRLLDETLVVWMGEFGRTPGPPPRFQGKLGRDHWAKAFSLVLAGGGVARGRVIGATDAIGAHVTDRPVTPQDFHASLYHAFGFDLNKKYMTLDGRPVKLIEKGSVVKELFA